MKANSSNLKYNWESDIVPHLGKIQAVEGGYTSAIRGIVTLPDGKKVFVKNANDEMTKKWLSKEIKVYEILNKAGYEHIPKLLSRSDDYSAMVIEYLEGYSFENKWDEDKLTAVLTAQDSLKQYRDLFMNDPEFHLGDVVDLGTKWPKLLEAENVKVINTKLLKLDIKTQFTREQIERLAQLHEGWLIKEDSLVHEDIRADNFGYDPKTKTGKLIDWNWICLGDESLDTTPLFINIYQSGFNPYELHPEKYDKKMLAYLLSYWLVIILNGDEDSSAREWKLRTAQAKSIEACAELLNKED